MRETFFLFSIEIFPVYSCWPLPCHHRCLTAPLRRAILFTHSHHTLWWPPEFSRLQVNSLSSYLAPQCPVLQAHNHLHGPSLDLLQSVHVSLTLGSPGLDLALQECLIRMGRGEGSIPSPSWQGCVWCSPGDSGRLLQITFLPIKCLEMFSRIVCSITFPQTDVKLTSYCLPRSSSRAPSRPPLTEACSPEVQSCDPGTCLVPSLQDLELFLTMETAAKIAQPSRACPVLSQW